MNDNPTKPIKIHWDSVQDSAAFDSSKLIELVRFLARCAAERDIKQQASNSQERQGTND